MIGVRELTWKDGLRGAWLVGLELLLYTAAIRIGFRLSESVTDYPGANPPWYFIRRDTISGACYFVALAICLAFALITRKRYLFYPNMLAWMSVLTFGGHVSRLIVILLSTHRLFEPDATTRWRTFQSYAYDGAIVSSQLFVFVLAILIAAAGMVKRRKRGRAVDARHDGFEKESPRMELG
ncbi:MAG TPA: hypothetical protein VH854_10905 [Thermoanaerobaculia bacterium]|nr:hypothetical protein [Thermoanaerobaculia bacterium]